MSLTERKPGRWTAFVSLNWYDGFIEFLFKFAAKTSELLLAAGLIVSAADFLTDGHVMAGNDTLSSIWAWNQAIAIESSAGVILVYGLESRKQRDYVKTGFYAVLGAMLAIVAGIMLYIQIAAHSLTLTEAAATLRLGINPQTMALLRSIVCIGFIVLSRTKTMTFSNFTKKAQPAQGETGSAISYDQLAEHLIPHLTPVLARLTRTIITEQYEATLSPTTTTRPAALPEPAGEHTGTTITQEREPQEIPAITQITLERDTETRLKHAYEKLQREGGEITGARMAREAGARKASALKFLEEM